MTRTGAAALASPRCLLYEFDRAGDTLTARAYAESSPTPGYAEIGVPLPLAKMPGNRAILDCRLPVVEQLADQGIDKHTRAEMAHWGEFTALNVPLFYKDEALGILMFIETGAERHYSPDELALAAGLGEQASIALQNARLYRRQEAQNARLLALLESSRAMTASLSAQQTIDGMKAEISNLLSGVDCRVGVHLRREDGAFETFVAHGERGSTTTRRKVRTDAIVTTALEQKHPVQAEPAKGRTRLVIPLLLKGELGFRRAVGTARPAVQRRRDRGRADPRQPDGGGRRERPSLREDRAPGHHRRAYRALQPPRVPRAPQGRSGARLAQQHAGVPADDRHQTSSSSTTPTATWPATTCCAPSAACCHRAAARCRSGRPQRRRGVRHHPVEHAGRRRPRRGRAHEGTLSGADRAGAPAASQPGRRPGRGDRATLPSVRTTTRPLRPVTRAARPGSASACAARSSMRPSSPTRDRRSST